MFYYETFNDDVASDNEIKVTGNEITNNKSCYKTRQLISLFD